MIIICNTAEDTKRCYQYCKDQNINVEEMDAPNSYITTAARTIFVNENYKISDNDLTFIKLSFNCKVYDSLRGVIDDLHLDSSEEGF